MGRENVTRPTVLLQPIYANSYRPYIFVTNGGGKTEEERCLDLSRQLQLEVSPGQFICGHTPMREMAERYGTVLVVGGEGEKCRQVAEGYGFKDVWYARFPISAFPPVRFVSGN